MKRIIVLTIGILSTVLLTGCMFSNGGTSNTIKIIREPKHSNTEKSQTRRKIQTGKIEVVNYNSSIISPEYIGYQEPQSKKDPRQSQNKYGDNVSNNVNNRVSSEVNSVQSKADNVVNSTIDNTVEQLFR